MQSHLQNLEHLLKKQVAPTPTQTNYKTPSLSDLPIGSELQNSLGTNPMSQNTTISLLFPGAGLSQLIPNSGLRTQQQPFTLQSPRIHSIGHYSHANTISDLTPASQVNRVNFLNTLISNYPPPIGVVKNNKIELGSRSMGGLMDVECSKSTGNRQILNLFPADQMAPMTLGSESMQDEIMRPPLLRPRIYSTGCQETTRKPYTLHDLATVRSATLSDALSPIQTRVISYNSTGGSPPSLWEIHEQKNIDLNPSLTSLDEEINEISTRPQTKTTNQGFSLSLNSQLEGLNINKEEPTHLFSRISQGSTPQGGFFGFANYLKPVSLPDLDIQQHRRQNFLEKMEEEDVEPFRYGIKSVPGVYTKEERASKILQYKKKIQKWRAAHPVNRAFTGRSAVAGSKPRIKGKFVSNEEYQMYLQKEKSKKCSETGMSDTNSQAQVESKVEECL